ncbi:MULTISPECIES: threonine/serine dehydratase [Pandoraea]|uniref:threonine ammonia-lyase n=1 Tax=Pandoraea TaxID=93217 RepID=UPI001F5C5F15|nr:MULTISPECIES: threonine/serine dehydratase [Pandoraea]MCI3206789.1 pyridoxal-5'-phosphate-dependent protein [Pandoraea sp. LA3]MDN4584817.1 pyridoxal-5'-phosphate-dependent protein [Pandoraea capi]
MSITMQSVREAAARIAGIAFTTPLIQSAELDRIAGTRVLLKAENLQKAGAFKFRGAVNKILTLSTEQRKAGVIAYSSGNHALAVAVAARQFSVHAVVLMPHDAPAVKVRGAKANGAEVMLYDRESDDREHLCAALIKERGLTLIPPYDDYDVMAGAGTGALEALEQIGDYAGIDTAMVCCSGGGLTSGWATTFRSLIPQSRIYAVEPEGFDDTGRSLEQGVRRSNARKSGTICDALVVPTPGVMTFDVMRRCDVEGIRVSDDEVRAAMRFAFNELKLVLEPSGSVALAALLTRKFRHQPSGVLAILSGGNVDRNTFMECIGQ